MNKKYLAVLGGGLITLSAIGAVVCSSITICMSSKVSNRVSLVQNDVTALSRAYITQEKKETDPEYVTINGGYEIRDTSAISDAYKNKDDSKLTTPEQKETLKMASDILTKITNDKMSLYEKELAIHDWIAMNVSGDDSNLSSVPTGSGDKFTPYGVLKSRHAVCVGYATTFKLFMNMVGADCMVEHSTELGHSWNVVKLDDNEWYIVDLWSDSNGTSKTSCSHEYFNITNDYLLANGSTFDTSLYPVASGTQYSYAVQNSKKLDDAKKLPKLIKDAVNKKTTELFFELPKNTDFKYTAAMLNGITNRINMADNDISISANYISTNKDTTIVAIKFNYPSSEESAEKNYPDLTKELDKLFGAYNNY